MSNFGGSYGGAYYSSSGDGSFPGGGYTGSAPSGARGGYEVGAQQAPPGAGGPAAAAAGFDASGFDEKYPRTCYVGNLEPSVSEEFISALFGQIGTVLKCKIIHEAGNEPYAFVEYETHEAANQALTAMNKRVLLGKEMKVNWATQPGTAARVDTSKHFHVFVGDLSLEVDNKALHDAFAPFGDISDAKVIRDLQTLKSKGYGFVSFINKEDAERAIEGMNGQWLGRRTIRTNWATRKPAGAAGKSLSFDEVYNQTTPGNTTVYVGGIGENSTEDDIRKAFAKFGTILDVRVFKQQGYSFVRFDNKESATHAIVNLNGTEINGSTVRCSWGRSGQDQQSGGGMGAGGNYGYGYGYGGGMGPAAGAAAQYWQQYYNQYYQQAAANPAMAMQQWQK